MSSREGGSGFVAPDGAAPPRCKTIGHHFEILFVWGWCGCGYAGCPRSPEEFAQRASGTDASQGWKSVDGEGA